MIQHDSTERRELIVFGSGPAGELFGAVVVIKRDGEELAVSVWDAADVGIEIDGTRYGPWPEELVGDYTDSPALAESLMGLLPCQSPAT